MNLTRFLNGTSHFCMAPEGEGGSSGGGASASVPAAGAPAKATTDTNSNASASATATAGQAAQASGDQSSAAASVPAGVGSQPGDQNANQGDFKSRLGDLAKDPALASFNSEADLAKSFLETKKLVGQKLGIPGPDATPEAKAAFFEAMGVPKTAEGYEFKKPEGLPDKLAELYSPENSKEWADFFREQGIPKEAANAIREKYFAEVSKDIQGMLAEADKSDEAFGKVAAEIYGDNTKANAALQSVRTMVEKHVPPQLKAGMEHLSNTALLIMAATIRGETMALTGEDKTISRDNGTASDGKTVAQLRDEARQLQALPEYSSPFTAKGKNAHDEVVAKVKGIYDRIGKMGA